MVICQALSNEFFAGVRDRGLWWELHLSCIEDCLVTHYCHLRLVVAERFHTEEKLVEDDAHAPDINLDTRSYKYFSLLLRSFAKLVDLNLRCIFVEKISKDFLYPSAYRLETLNQSI